MWRNTIVLGKWAYSSFIYTPLISKVIATYTVVYVMKYNYTFMYIFGTFMERDSKIFLGFLKDFVRSRCKE